MLVGQCRLSDTEVGNGIEGKYEINNASKRLLRAEDKRITVFMFYFLYYHHSLYYPCTALTLCTIPALPSPSVLSPVLPSPSVLSLYCPHPLYFPKYSHYTIPVLPSPSTILDTPSLPPL